MRERSHDNLFWGLLLALVATLMLCAATGNPVPARHLMVSAPVVMILLGVLGVVLTRRR